MSHQPEHTICGFCGEPRKLAEGKFCCSHYENIVEANRRDRSERETRLPQSSNYSYRLALGFHMLDGGQIG